MDDAFSTRVRTASSQSKVEYFVLTEAEQEAGDPLSQLSQVATMEPLDVEKVEFDGKVTGFCSEIHEILVKKVHEMEGGIVAAVLHVVLVIFLIIYVIYCYQFLLLPARIAPALKTYSETVDESQLLPPTLFCSRVKNVRPRILSCAMVFKIAEHVSSNINCLPTEKYQYIFNWVSYDYEWQEHVLVLGKDGRETKVLEVFNISCWLLNSTNAPLGLPDTTSHLDISFLPLNESGESLTYWNHQPGMYVYYHPTHILTKEQIDKLMIYIGSGSGIIAYEFGLAQTFISSISRQRLVYLNNSFKDSIAVDNYMINMSPNGHFIHNNVSHLLSTFAYIQLFWKANYIFYNVEFYTYSWLDITTGLLSLLAVRTLIPYISIIFYSCLKKLGCNFGSATTYNYKQQRSGRNLCNLTSDFLMSEKNNILYVKNGFCTNSRCNFLIGDHRMNRT